MLSTALNQGVLNTPTKRYIHKLADETEWLNTCHILQQRETDNLRSIIQKRRVQNKGKRAVLKGQFHISTEELQSQVAEAEAATTATSQKSKISTTPQVITSIIDLIDDESEEEQFDSDLDELAL
jgi:hypothetical protein